ncbi:MAG: cadmium-translocating P-type ATPase [Chloroflexi bacterium]|nr:MAG: cadmium-translocating P-type ATPase [Chloroflexota bacterium]
MLYPIARNGWNSLRINHTFNINALMTIAAIGALIIGEYLEAATVIFLFVIGEALEGYTASRARASIGALMALKPQQALVIRDGQELLLPVEEVTIGDEVLVKAGERIPVDGEIIAGESAIDQSPITGESVPVHKTVGDEVYTATVNGNGTLRVRVTALAEDNTLSRIIRLVEEAQSARAPSQRVVDRFAQYYTPAVAILALLVAVVPPLLFNAPFCDTPDGHGWLYRALALLVIACPCALVISTPVTVISAITAAARQGVLIKGGAHLEALGTLKAIIFDKTGTLTKGRPLVQYWRSVDCDTGADCELCDDVLALAAAVERGSSHPLAQAVINAAQDRALDVRYPVAETVATLAGQGVTGQISNQQVTIGNHRWFDADYPHPTEICEQVASLERQGQTAMLLHDGERVRGFISVADTLRDEGKTALSQLRKLGLYTVMSTGDNREAAQAIGEQLGLDEIHAELLPEDKVQVVQDLRQRLKNVAMVGDGVNDTPALAAAMVGIAMGAAGSAQALETADVALMSDDLSKLPFTIRLARFARRLIKQNIVLSFGVKAMFIVLALLGLASLWMAVLADVGVSLLVTLNGMRPMRQTTD